MNDVQLQWGLTNLIFIQYSLLFHFKIHLLERMTDGRTNMFTCTIRMKFSVTLSSASLCGV